MFWGRKVFGFFWSVVFLIVLHNEKLKRVLMKILLPYFRLLTSMSSWTRRDMKVKVM